NNANGYNPQVTTKVAVENSANVASNAANQSAFSSYIGQAFAQIGVANPTNVSAPVVSGTSKPNSPEQSMSSFINDLFAALSQNDSSKQPLKSVVVQVNYQPPALKEHKNPKGSSDHQQIKLPSVTENRKPNVTENANVPGVTGNAKAPSTTEVQSVNKAAIAAYADVKSTTVGNLALNLQSLVKQLDGESSGAQNEMIKVLKDGFQRILNEQNSGIGGDNSKQLGSFLQTLAQNLHGQSPLGIIVNAQV
ncbi:MAG: hypothetical protein RL236_1135, partial [Pseudomonadota bacterium]